MKLVLIHWAESTVFGLFSSRFKNVNGDLLRELQRMRVNAADYFYSTLKTDLKMNFVQVLKFSGALDKL